MATSSASASDKADCSAHPLPLDVLLQTGDIQLVCDDGELTAHSQILAAASPEVLAGAIEAAQGKQTSGPFVAFNSKDTHAKHQRPSIKVTMSCLMSLLAWSYQLKLHGFAQASCVGAAFHSQNNWLWHISAPAQTVFNQGAHACVLMA